MKPFSRRCARIARRLVVVALIQHAAQADGARPDFCEPLVEQPVAADAAGDHGHGLLWRVTHADGPVSYVFGTMHIADPRVLGVIERVTPALEQTVRFAREVALDPAAMATVREAMFFQDGRTLSGVAGEELFGLTARHLEGHGLSAAVVDAMKPWAALTTLSTPSGIPGQPLDALLARAAQAAGKDIVALETAAEQVAVFDALTLSQQIEKLREAACHYERFQADLEELIARYEARDLAGLLELTLRYTDEEQALFLDTLIWERNERMVERVIPMFATAATFVAIGALHLPGPRGVLRLLEAQGFEVEAVY